MPAPLGNQNRRRHGHAATARAGGRVRCSPTYATWQAMKERCYREKQRSYPDYGGRGIKVCARWHDFTNFLADMGERPDGMTIDRIDVNGDYEPGNCRWATASEQRRNQRAA